MGASRKLVRRCIHATIYCRWRTLVLPATASLQISLVVCKCMQNFTGLLRELNPAPRTRSENHASRPSGQVLVDTHTHKLTLRLAGSKFRHRCRSPLCRNKRVLMLCDNMAVVMAFNKGRCQNHALLRLTRKLAAFALCHNIFYRFRYVESA